MAYMKVVGAGWRCSNGLGGIFRGWRIGVNMLSHNICPQTLTSDELQVAENVLQSLSQCSPKQVRIYIYTIYCINHIHRILKLMKLF